MKRAKITEIHSRLPEGFPADTAAGRPARWGGLRGWSAALGELIAPPLCVRCGELTRRGRLFLCADCSRSDGRRAPCMSCGEGPNRDGELDRRCPVCRMGGLGFPVRFVGEYEHSLRELILAAKWRGGFAQLSALVTWMIESASAGEWHQGLDGWIAIPRHPLRRLWYGAPLAEHLGYEMGRALGIRRLPAPRRTRRAAQALLSGVERRRNLRGAFRMGARGARKLAGRRVLLVDDVLTTGSTLKECAATILAAGASEVRGLVLAVQPETASQR